jgi:hypothetical protein
MAISLQRAWRWAGSGAMTAIAACAGASTQLQSTWIDPTFDAPPFRQLAVLALFESEAESRNFEHAAVGLLAERDIEAVEGRAILDAAGRDQQTDLQARLLEAVTGGVLIFRQIAVDERDVYVAPGPYLERIPGSILWSDPYYWYYYPHWHYYWHSRAIRDATRAPGYWSTLRYVIVESSLYDGKTHRLVWTAKSETMNPDLATELAESIVGKVTRELVAARLVAPAAASERLAGLQ